MEMKHLDHLEDDNDVIQEEELSSQDNSFER